MRQPGKFSEFKDNFNAWTKQTYEVTSVKILSGSNVYELAGHARPVRDHEILKVSAVQKPPRPRVVGKQGENARLQKPVRRVPIRGKQPDPH